METTDRTLPRPDAFVTSLNRCIEAAIDGQKSYGAAFADVRAPALKGIYESALVTPVNFPERTYQILTAQRDAVRAAINDMKKRLGFPAERYNPVTPPQAEERAKAADPQ